MGLEQQGQELVFSDPKVWGYTMRTRRMHIQLYTF